MLIVNRIISLLQPTTKKIESTSTSYDYTKLHIAHFWVGGLVVSYLTLSHPEYIDVLFMDYFAPDPKNNNFSSEFHHSNHIEVYYISSKCFSESFIHHCEVSNDSYTLVPIFLTLNSMRSGNVSPTLSERNSLAKEVQSRVDTLFFVFVKL